MPADARANIRVTTGDGARIGQRRPGEYDRVVVDAPCSGERHLLATPAELARWSAKSSQRLAVRQHALLGSGFDVLREGGRLIYSTCTISPRENDGVIEKLLKSRRGQFEAALTDGRGEATRFGRLVQPDVEDCGPIYFAVIEKELPPRN